MTPIRIRGLQFAYDKADTVLDIRDFQLNAGELVFLFGPSGCGKTTLLSLISGVLTVSAGELSVLGQDLTSLTHTERDRLRGTSIGYIFQIFNLIPYLNVEQNILLPTLFGRPVSSGFKSPQDEARALADALGIGDLITRPVYDLSIGQQQRVAAARALFGSPGLILADEPTSSLDTDARGVFLELLFSIARREKSSVLFVSHDRSLAPLFDREVSLPTLNLVKGGRS